MVEYRSSNTRLSNTTGTAAAWGDPTYSNSTGSIARQMVAVDARELAAIRGAADHAEATAVHLSQKFSILEAKFDKAIEILTARGINITELV